VAKHERRLNFTSSENINPVTQTQTVSYKRDLQRLTQSLYEVPMPLSATSASTNLQPVPELCLHAPGLADDFYSRLTAWSSDDLLAVATPSSVVYRNMRNEECGYMFCTEPAETVTCVGWRPEVSPGGLVIGNDVGQVSIFDATTKYMIRQLSPPNDCDAVGDFSWKDANMLTVGYQCGLLRQFDMREPRGGKIFRSHRSRVCGVAWNPAGQYLATGGGDAIVALWDSRSDKTHILSSLPPPPPELSPPVSSDGIDIPMSTPQSSSGPRNPSLSNLNCFLRTKKHISTVKALAWCPWQPDLLATGGGTKDGAIRFWDVKRARLKRLVINTNSQVSSLHFAPTCREIVSTHGYAFAPTVDPDGTGPALPAPRRHSLLVHNYPKGEQVARVFEPAHGRITHSALNPDGTRIVTCGSDHSMRVYKIFGKQDVVQRTDHTSLSTNVIR
jgi:cell division cycle 20, cofactor of APC complex